MVKHRSVTYLVALALLGCLVEAQSTYGTSWRPPQEPRVPSVPVPPKQPPKQHGAAWRVPQDPRVPSAPVPPPPEPPKQHGAAWRTPQAPKVPSVPAPPPPGPPRHTPKQPGQHTPPAQSCDVEERVKIPCGCPHVTYEGCLAISCCHDGHRCYYGSAVTVQCTKDAQFIVVVARDATLPNLDLETVQLNAQGHGCARVDSNSGFAIFQFPVAACGTDVMEESGVIIYENRMTSSYEVATGHRGAVTRDSVFDLRFQCRYTGASIETLVVQTYPFSDPVVAAGYGALRVELRLGNGVCTTKGCNEVDVAYSSYYAETDYPVTKVLKDPVYVEVRVKSRTDPNLVLNLGRCWTTTTPNPHSLPQWDLLIDGCPSQDDNRYLSTLVPVDPSTGPGYKRFIFKMFSFVDDTSKTPLREEVYIHCSTSACIPGAGVSCEKSCYRYKRDAGMKTSNTTEPRPVTSSQCVVMVPPAL